MSPSTHIEHYGIDEQVVAEYIELHKRLGAPEPSFEEARDELNSLLEDYINVFEL